MDDREKAHNQGPGARHFWAAAARQCHAPAQAHMWVGGKTQAWNTWSWGRVRSPSAMAALGGRRKREAKLWP